MKQNEKSYTLIGVLVIVIIAVLAYGMYRAMDSDVAPEVKQESKEEVQTE